MAQVKIRVKVMERDAAERGWMRTDLARAAGVSDATLSHAWRGGSATAKTVRKVATALGRPVRRYLAA